MEEVAVLKKEASDERLRRIESEQTVSSYHDVLKIINDKHLFFKKAILSKLEGRTCKLALWLMRALSRLNHSYYYNLSGLDAIYAK